MWNYIALFLAFVALVLMSAVTVAALILPLPPYMLNPIAISWLAAVVSFALQLRAV